MTRREMERYGELCDRIEAKRRLLRELRKNGRIVTDKVRGSETEYPYTEHSITLHGVPADRALTIEEEELETEVEQLIVERDDQRKRIEDYIASLPDNRHQREILTCVYIKRWSQRKTGEVVGYSQASISNIIKIGLKHYKE